MTAGVTQVAQRDLPAGNFIAGACKRDYRTIRCGRFVWPAASGRLMDMVCPICGDRLDQTSRHSQGTWYVIDGELARSLARPLKLAHNAASKAEEVALAAYDAEHPEPGRDDYSARNHWHTQRWMVGTHAYEQALDAARVPA